MSGSCPPRSLIAAGTPGVARAVSLSQFREGSRGVRSSADLARSAEQLRGQISVSYAAFAAISPRSAAASTPHRCSAKPPKRADRRTPLASLADEMLLEGMVTTERTPETVTA